MLQVIETLFCCVFEDDKILIPKNSDFYEQYLCFRMSEERREDVVTGGPGDVYQPFVIMEELLDKLKLLRYEESFCRQLGFKPFSR